MRLAGASSSVAISRSRAVSISRRTTLGGDDRRAREVLLRRFVDRIEVTKEEDRVVYTFLILETVYNMAHSWGYLLDWLNRARRDE
jgi:hypothetical protein